MMQIYAKKQLSVAFMEQFKVAKRVYARQSTD